MGGQSPPRLVLVVNAGSSSLKYEVIDGRSGHVEAKGIVDAIGGASPTLRHLSAGESHERQVSCPDHAEAFSLAAHALETYGPDLRANPLVAVGHRVVHGGARFSEPTVVDDDVITALRELVPLAPLHNPANIEGIERARSQFPDLPQVAVFDTAFHHGIPARAHTYAVPRQWRERHGVRRYGFHGTSHAYVSRRLAALLGKEPEEVDVIVLHLGNGASACAVQGGHSIDTSMGLSPLEGLVMGTRSGDVDPSLGSYLSRVAGLDAQAYDDALNHDSGLVGLSGHSDFREVDAMAAAGDEQALLAIEVMTYRLRKYVGAYAAALGRLDAIAFTGGIGEHSPRVRARVLEGLTVLGVEFDAAANAAVGGAEALLTTPSSRVAAFVVPTREELEIARACLAVIDERRPV